MNRRLALFNPDDDAPDPGASFATPRACEPTLERLQRVLDGEEPSATLDADEHARDCARCRERTHAARMMTAALARSSTKMLTSPERVDALLAAIAADRPSSRRSRRVFAALGLAIAAGVLFMLFTGSSPWIEPGVPVLVEAPKPALPVETPPPRLGEAFADAGNALENIGRQFTEPPMDTPDVLTPLAGVFDPPMNPFTTDLEPVARTLSELPEAALSGLEPVTDSASRAFSRLLQDVSAVQPTLKPKS